MSWLFFVMQANGSFTFSFILFPLIYVLCLKDLRCLLSLAKSLDYRCRQAMFSVCLDQV